MIDELFEIGEALAFGDVRRFDAAMLSAENRLADARARLDKFRALRPTAKPISPVDADAKSVDLPPHLAAMSGTARNALVFLSLQSEPVSIRTIAETTGMPYSRVYSAVRCTGIYSEFFVWHEDSSSVSLSEMGKSVAAELANFIKPEPG